MYNEKKMNGNNSSSQKKNTQTITVSAVLQLRADQPEDTPEVAKKEYKPKVKWHENVIDNENMNKKKTKICCIFHPQQNFENEQEEYQCCHHSSSSESDNDESLNFEVRRQMRIERRVRKLERARSQSPNAYEVQPDYRKYRIKYLNLDK